MLPGILLVPFKPLSLSKRNTPVLFKVDWPAKAHLSSPLNSFIPPYKLKRGEAKRGSQKPLLPTALVKGSLSTSLGLL
jgi:hypothetical protein